jgi:hypothetical protein
MVVKNFYSYANHWDKNKSNNMILWIFSSASRNRVLCTTTFRRTCCLVSSPIFSSSATILFYKQSIVPEVSQFAECPQILGCCNFHVFLSDYFICLYGCMVTTQVMEYSVFFTLTFFFMHCPAVSS